MSPETINPFAPGLKQPIPSLPVAERLLGSTGVELFQRAQRRERIIDRRDASVEDERIIDLSAEMVALKESRELKPGEFVLELAPGDTSPSKDLITAHDRGGYKLEERTSHYITDRAFAELALTEADLVAIGLRAALLRQELLKLNQAPERACIAKIVGIEQLTREKQKLDPEADDLTTAEVLLFIDSQGYRPATCKEMLAYAKDHWKPETDAILTLEEEEQLADTRFIACLGSGTTDDLGHRRFMTLWGDKGEHALGLSYVSTRWPEQCCFLVVRK